MASFCWYRRVGGSEKVQKYADVVYWWSLIPYYPQQLTNDFRYNYAQFWHSILKADLEGIKQSADCLGVGNLYGLFACMVTGRSWGSIQKGIDKAEKNSAEVGIFEKKITITIMCILTLISLLLIFFRAKKSRKTQQDTSKKSQTYWHLSIDKWFLFSRPTTSWETLNSH